SYQDISEALGLTKASIHYHFPSKADLGAAVVDSYAQRFCDALAAPDQKAKTSAAPLDFYVQTYLQFAQKPGPLCLCRALAGELLTLPPDMRKRVDRFFTTHHAWLAGILERGAARGEFTLPAPAAKTARLVFGALQGALLVKRTTGDMAQMKDVV